MIRVLFVCSGNICRSPMADGIFRHMVRKAGLSGKIEVDSAGTGAWHVGERPQEGTMRMLRKHGVDDYDGRARRVAVNDLDEYDYLLAMDGSHLRYLRQLGETEAEVEMFLKYANDADKMPDGTMEVPDPYYNNKFQRVYDLVLVGNEALLDYIRNKHNI